MFILGLIVGGIAGMCFMCLFQFETKTEQRTETDREEEMIAEVKSCGEFIKDYCDWQGSKCTGCVLYDADKRECKVGTKFPRDWGAIE